MDEHKKMTLQFDEKVKTILDVLPIPIVIKKKNCQIVYANSAFQSNITEINSDSFCYLLKGNQERCLSCPLELIWKENEPTIQYLGIIGDKDILSFAYPILDANGEKAVIEFVIPIDKKSEMAKKLEVSKMKDILIELLIHDLNNDIAVMEDYIELLEDEVIPIEFFITKIKMRIKKASQLLNDVESYFKYLTQKLGYPRKRYLNLEEMIYDAIMFNEKQIKEKKLAITVVVPHNKKILAYDILSEALNNVISNAIKYSPERGKIEIWASIKDGYLIIEVKDEGIGITEEEKKKLFVPFARLDDAKKLVKGKGLGLVVTLSIIEMHDGVIEVLNNEPKGTIFRIKIPYSENE